MKKIMVPTGYMGTGSSAITDFMREFDGYHVINSNFEYIFLHCPNGVFDLEDKLLVGNNALRSDEAIRSFEDMMHQLYYRKLWWVANYKKNLGKDFLQATDNYIRELVQYMPRDYWYMQQRLNFPRFLWMGIRMVLRKVSRGKIQLKPALEYAPMRISLLEPEEFYRASRKYLREIFKIMGAEEKNLILDQLLLPFNLWRAENYFGEELECFVVDRDPRDVFILNKYVWPFIFLGGLPYPTEVGEFCDYFHRLRRMERETSNPHIHRFHFEDLVYQYDEKAGEIMEIMKVSPEQQKRKRMFFDPDKSIHNTQLFIDKKYEEEVRIIEERLGDYLYDFPYEIEVK